MTQEQQAAAKQVDDCQAVADSATDDRQQEPSPRVIHSGFLAVVGRPNVGKSTLTNALVGEKVCIVSRKAQTTRQRVTGILTTDEAQFVFVDTPGFQTRHNNALNRAMNRGVKQALSEVDVVLWVVEAGVFDQRDQALLPLLPDNKPVILVINKTDAVKNKLTLLPFIAQVSAVFPFAAVVPVSAQKGKQTADLLAEAQKHLPQEGLLYSEDDFTNQSERMLAAEYLREKLFRLLGDELPYAAAVEIEKFELEESGGDVLRRIFAAVVVERDSHKAIVIGKNGETLKRIASEARQDMRRLFGGSVYLEVWVKVKSGWADDERLLRSLGYDS